MNMKQKLTYMLIGCLFTLAGFVLSSLFNTPTQAQDQKKTVFDKIVCKELEIVNDEGQTMAELDSIFGFGYLSIYNADGKELVRIGSVERHPNDGLINIYNNRGDRRSISAD